MNNSDISKKLEEIAYFLEIDGVKYKPFAYRRASSSIASLSEELTEVYRKNGREGLEEVSGIGENIADKIEELILTGEMEHLQSLKKKFPIDIEKMSAIRGIGPKNIKKLYNSLGIKSIKELESFAIKGEISSLERFGKKTEENILEAIDFLKRDEGKWGLGEVDPVAGEIFERLKKLKDVKKISFAGSLRRKKELIGDVDILVSASSSKKIMEKFTSFKKIEKITGKGETKSSIRLKQGINVDLRVVEGKSFGAALQYFTGSKSHNIKLRKLAVSKGYKLSEYGLFKNGKRVAGKSEEEVYRKLGLSYIPPELREDKGEVEKAISNNFSDLCEISDIKGDLHIHSNWSGGVDSIRDIADYGKKKRYSYLGIADHTKELKIENGLDEKRLLEQRVEIDRINEEIRSKNGKIVILQGCEANILKDGNLDIDNSALERLDYVIAGVHSHFEMEKEDMTERIIKAIEHPQVKIISHPTGRLIKRRKELVMDFGKILKAAKKNGVALEINSSPARLDLGGDRVRDCVESGVRLVINTDSHNVKQMENMMLGIAQARRGWANSSDIINTFDLSELKLFLNEK